MASINYRPDIDGLRALAVLAVIFFHYGIAPFSGGFIGVDVFFVISGYLITKIIIEDIEHKRFTFKNFFFRRAKRLLPALIATLLLCFIAAFFIFSPHDFETFGREIFYASLSLSNIYFWQDLNYFNSDALIRPLLHTWSLAVEVQFYILWPLLLMLLLRLFPFWLVSVFILCIGLTSFVLGEVFKDGFYLFFDGMFGNGSANVFYLTPFRIFEFIFGAALVWLERHKIRHLLINETLCLAGLGFIIYAGIIYNENTLFPSWNALLPCLGTALVIFSAPQTNYTGLILKNPISVNIGLISYSLYLIHWPLLVFCTYWTGQDLSGFETGCTIALSIILAAIMYKWVEVPFRKNKKQNGEQSHQPKTSFVFLSSSIGLISLIAVLGLQINHQKGWLERFSEDVQKHFTVPYDTHADYNWRNIELYKEAFSDNKGLKALVIGDSQASDFINMLRESQLDQAMNLKFHSIIASCQPMFGINQSKFIHHVPWGKRDLCKNNYDLLNQDVSIAEADVIILSALWTEWSYDYVSEITKNLKEAGAKKIVVIGPKDQGISGLRLFLTQRSSDILAQTAFNNRPNHALKADARLKEHAKSYSYFDFYDFLCEDQKCSYQTPSGEALFFDSFHLTQAGAQFLGEAFNTRQNRVLLNFEAQ